MRQKKSKIFVIMPFDEEFNDTYQFGIKEVCNKIGAAAQRVDEQIHNEAILDRIQAQIRSADLVIADLTTFNPNVLYETGYAHALGKQVIHLIRKGQGLPFDLNHYPFVIYDSIVDLTSKLSPRVQNALQSTHLSQTRLPWRVCTDFYPIYPKDEVFDSIANAKREVLILQTWIGDWNQLTISLERALGLHGERAVSRSGASIKIILIDPETDFCALRGIHSGKSEQAAREGCRAIIHAITRFKKDHNLENQRLELRLANELPTFAMFSADSAVYFIPYLRQKTTIVSPCFRFEAGSNGFVSELRDHFDGLWTLSEPVS